MRTTIILEESLVSKAREMTGISRITDLVRTALETLIAEEARKRLIAFGGTDPEATAPARRYPSKDFDTAITAAEKPVGDDK